MELECQQGKAAQNLYQGQTLNIGTSSSILPKLRVKQTLLNCRYRQENEPIAIFTKWTFTLID